MEIWDIIYADIKNSQKISRVYKIWFIFTGFIYIFNSNLINKIEFFISCILLGLEYIHTNGIIHRDIKPENLVLDEKGFVRITDFGIAKVYQKENHSETSGTPGYMSPEVMCAQNHTIAVDYFAVGVLAFEFMFGFVSIYLKNIFLLFYWLYNLNYFILLMMN